MKHFLSGAVFMAACVSALFFLRFWKESRDRFFLLFAFAFVLFGIERLPFLALALGTDARGSIYLLRLFAYIVILGAILDKNRGSA